MNVKEIEADNSYFDRELSASLLRSGIEVLEPYQVLHDCVAVPHIGELSNQFREELQILYRIKPLLKPKGN